MKTCKIAERTCGSFIHYFSFAAALVVAEVVRQMQWRITGEIRLVLEASQISVLAGPLCGTVSAQLALLASCDAAPTSREWTATLSLAGALKRGIAACKAQH